MEEEIWRQIDRALASEDGDVWPIPPRYAVHLPFVDDLSVATVGADLAPNRLCDSCAAAKFLDEVSMSLHRANIRKPFGVVKPSSSENVSGDFPNDLPHHSDMARPKNPEAVAAGARLRRTREALGLKRRRMAQILDVPEDNLEKWEGGGAMTPPYFVRKLNATYGITYEWIYDGNSAKLPHDLALRLLDPSEDAAE
jgi:DNA-binding transcriptional regulator YiaG